VNGVVAAVRLATEPAAQAAAKREVAAYERLADLQGTSLPRLLAFGAITGKAAYFVATEFLEVCCGCPATSCNFCVVHQKDRV
jgi:hypothetical protein